MFFNVRYFLFNNITWVSYRIILDSSFNVFSETIPFKMIQAVHTNFLVIFFLFLSPAFCSMLFDYFFELKIVDLMDRVINQLSDGLVHGLKTLR